MKVKEKNIEMQNIIDRHLREFYEIHNEKIPISLRPYIFRIVNECLKEFNQ